MRCSKDDVRVRSMFDKMVFNPSLQKFEFLLIPKKENMNILVKIGPLKVSKFDF